MSSFRIFAPAKINLFLHVTGKRADGYHLLQSLVVFANVGDTLDFAEDERFVLNVQGPFAGAMPPLGENIIEKAARLLAEAYDLPLQARITLTKNVPVAAGIGGGSADAAAALKGLLRLWCLPVEPEKIRDMALQLGADVPACFTGGHPLWMEGIGEKLTPVANVPPLHLVLANPGVATPTAQVFKKYKEVPNKPVPLPVSNALAFIEAARNDLTEAAIQVTPEIEKVLTALQETKGCLLHRLSGSGATCFGVYPDVAAAEQAANEVQARYPGWWVTPAKMLE